MGDAAFTIGSNHAGPHPSNRGDRPVDLPEWQTSNTGDYRVGGSMLGEQWPGRKGPFKIIIVGTGAAGIDFLHHAPKALADLDVEIKCFEKNPDVGGTWYENRYPGCACDGPSASYQYPWRPNPDWSSYYCGSKEIWEYLKGIVLDERLDQYIQLSTKVTKAIWDKGKSRWVLVLSKVDGSQEWEEECDVFLNGTGILNAWRWPNIPGIETFQGRLFHTASYEEGFDMKGKKVAIIGSGSSGVQAVATLLPDCEKMYTWVRNPTWITAGFAQKFTKNGSNFEYSEEEKAEWRSDPKKHLEYRKFIESELNLRYRSVMRNTEESQHANEFSYNEMATKLASKPELAAKIIPKDFNVGCRRPTPGNGYLEALVDPKTTVFTETIGSITPSGFTDHEGTEYAVDVIICATGFDTSFRPQFPVTGLNDVSLQERWADVPESYLGLAAPRMPNYFTFCGPFSPVSQGSILPILTQISKYFLQIIRKMNEQHIRRIVPKDAVIAQFMEHTRAYLPRTCWADPCPSWFKGGTRDGPLVMWPGSRLAFFKIVESPQWEDFDIEYLSGSRFGFLGSGFVKYEFEGDDITPYLDCEFVNALPRKQVQEMIAAEAEAGS